MELYHFEFRGEAGWEAFGSGVGSGVDPTSAAMADLAEIAEGSLPDGEYRCISATSRSPRWESVWLGPDGRIDVPGALASRSSEFEPRSSGLQMEPRQGGTEGSQKWAMPIIRRAGGISSQLRIRPSVSQRVK
jgi:hypothetical protein